MARHQTRPLLAFLVILFACVAALPAQAHVVTAASEPPTAATDVVSGTVDALVVEDRVRGVTVTYPLLRQDDGTIVPLVGTEAGALPPGSRVGIVGRWDRRQFEVAQTQMLAAPSAPSGQPATNQVTGTLFIAHADDFASGQSRFIHEVHEDSGRVTTLELATLPSMLRGGMRISVSGTLGSAPNSLSPQTITILSDPSAPTSSSSPNGPLSATINSVLVIMANFNNTAAPAFTQAQAQAVMTTNTSSVSNFYNEMSYGQQQLNVTVTNWVTMNMAQPSTCDFSSIQSAASAAATAAGYTVPAYPGFVVYLFPSLSSCGWSGLAYVGSPHWAFINGPGSFFTLVVAHEMGHNFGLLHAGSLNCGAAVIGGSCSVAEYGDPWDTMGNQNAMHFNAYQKSEINFISLSALKTHSSGTASYTLQPLEQAGGAVYGVVVPTANTSRTYLLEFRQPIGFDAGLASYPNLGAQIRVRSPFEWSSGADDTEIVDMTPGSANGFYDSALTLGNTYNDGLYGISITVTAATSSALTVSVTKSSGTATTTTLTSSPNPSNAGTTVTLTGSVTGTSPTGTVNFLDGGASIGGCSAIALSGSANTRTAACSTASLVVGTHNITAVYSGDGANAGSTSNAVSQVVNGTPSATTLATSLTPSTVGANVTFTATVSGTSPTGSVNFKDGSTSISGCSAATLTGSGNIRTASCATSALAVGNHSITAAYSGDASNGASTSGALTQTVNKSTTSTALTSSVNPSAVGSSVTFTASVTGYSPTGSINLTDGGVSISGCSAVALAGSGNTRTAQCSTSSLAASTHTIVANYGGDANNLSSGSSPLSQVVNGSAPPASLVNPGFETPALAAGGYQYAPSGSGVGWTFSGGGGVQANGSAWGAKSAPEGVQTAFIQSTGTISQAISLAAGTYTLSFMAAQRACCVSPYVQPVKVTLDGAQIGSLISPATTSFTPFSIVFTVAASGTHTIGFTGTDATDKTTFIDAMTLNSGTVVAVTTSVTSAANPSKVNKSVTFTATVTGNNPTGNVAFTTNGTTISGCGSVALSGSGTRTAACTTIFSTKGNYSIVGRYGGDASNAASTSAALVQSITKN